MNKADEIVEEKQGLENDIIIFLFFLNKQGDLVF